MVTDKRLDLVAVPAGMQKSGQIHKTFRKELMDLRWGDGLVKEEESRTMSPRFLSQIMEWKRMIFHKVVNTRSKQV